MQGGVVAIGYIVDRQVFVEVKNVAGCSWQTATTDALICGGEGGSLTLTRTNAFC